jgi:hypothetical protein
MYTVLLLRAYLAVVALLCCTHQHVANVAAELLTLIPAHAQLTLMLGAVVGLIELIESEAMRKHLGILSLTCLYSPAPRFQELTKFLIFFQQHLKAIMRIKLFKGHFNLAFLALELEISAFLGDMVDYITAFDGFTATSLIFRALYQYQAALFFDVSDHFAASHNQLSFITLELSIRRLNRAPLNHAVIIRRLEKPLNRDEVVLV